jgi:N-acetylmuramoyl-L-alanine amidase
MPKLKLLKNVNKIILCAGHGGDDPGAVNGQFREADQTIYLVDKIADILRKGSINVDVVPHNLRLVPSIGWVNQRYTFGNSWAIEVHRNSATVSGNQADRECGAFYYGGSSESKEVADILAANLTAVTGYNAWSRSDTKANGGRLGWIRDTKPAAHLIELGFMQGRNDNEHLDFLADCAAKVIYKTLTGDDYSVLGQQGIEWARPENASLYLNAKTNNDWQYIINTLIDRDAEIANLNELEPAIAVRNAFELSFRYTTVRNANDWQAILSYINDRDKEIIQLLKN